jgi:hypothetical protein
VRNVTYVAWAAILLAVGALDILLFFRPIETLLVSLLIAAACFYRKIIETYVQVISVSRKFLLVSLIAIATNLAVGFSLNAAVDLRARDLVARIESYKSNHGVFPKSLLEVAEDSERDRLRRDRILHPRSGCKCWSAHGYPCAISSCSCCILSSRWL